VYLVLSLNTLFYYYHTLFISIFAGHCPTCYPVQSPIHQVLATMQRVNMSTYHLTVVTALFATQAIAGGLNVPLPDNNLFDYIVVGGGPAGLTVANRLSENADVQVLLLESGEADNYPESIMIPYYQGAAGSVNGRCGGFNWYEALCTWTRLDTSLTEE
jgi:hypothetical protein